MKNINPIVTYLIVLLSFLGFSSTSFASETEIENTIDKMFARDYLNGTIRVSVSDELVIHKSHGLAHPGIDVKYTNDSAFGIGSISKSFTAAAIMKLVDAGKLSVDDKIVDIIPNSPDSWKSITIHQLLVHNSGLKDYLNDRVEYLKANLENFHSEKDILDVIKKMPLANTVGKFRYSNSGYFLLGQIIGIKSGISWQKYIKKELLVPLKLTNTFVDFYDYGPFHRQKIIKKRVGRLSRLYDNPIHENYGINPSLLNAAGSIISTARDLEKWIRGLYYGDLLSEASKKAIFKPYTKVESSSGMYFGYGWVIKKIGDRNYIWHNGSTFFELSYLFFDPEDSLVYVSNNNLAELGMTSYLNGFNYHIKKITKAKSGKTPWFPNILKPKIFKESDVQSIIGTYVSKALGFTAKVSYYQGKIVYQMVDKDSGLVYMNMFNSENAVDWVANKDVTTLNFEKKDKVQNLVFQINNKAKITMEKISGSSLTEEELKVMDGEVMMKNLRVGPILPEKMWFEK